MASYSISYTNTSVTFNVSGLTSGDSVRFYVRYDPSLGSPVVDITYTAAGAAMSRTFTISQSSSYAVNCEIGTTWLGAQYFTTGSDRPSNWSWSSGLTSGSAIRLYASEWNSFLERINEFRAYKGLGDYSFTSAVSGRSMTAIQANQARTAISDISGHGALPAAVVSGGTIYASFFNQLATALNAIS